MAEPKFDKLVAVCNDLLKYSKEAEPIRNYILSRVRESDIDQYGFGFFPEDKNIDLLFDKLDKKYLQEINVVYPKYISLGHIPHGHFYMHNLILPYYDVYGNVVAILGRTLLNDEDRKELKLDKYKYNHGCKKGLHVYGLKEAKQSILEKGYVICTEGQFDCIALQTHGISNAVAMGWANVSMYQMYQISKYTKNIYLFFDNDSAGKEGHKRVKEKYQSKGNLNIKTIGGIKEYKDVDEFLKKETDIAYKNIVIEKLRDIHF
jgi:DNA primase catalytic core